MSGPSYGGHLLAGLLFGPLSDSSLRLGLPESYADLGIIVNLLPGQGRLTPAQIRNAIALGAGPDLFYG